MRNGYSKAYSICALAIFLIGCSPSGTYPPVEITGKLIKPTHEPIPTLMAVAIRYARENYGKDQDLAINLPAGTTAEAYETVFKKVGGGRPMMDSGEKAIHIQEVRSRNFNAQVDLIYPRADGLNQLVTLTLHRGMLEKYRVERARAWQIRDVEAPEPSYVPTAAKAFESGESSEKIVTAEK